MGQTDRTLRSMLLFAGLAVAGFAVNFYPFELFFNIQFIFGGVFAMLALQLLGLRSGIAAALIISSVTYRLWNHPYALVIMTAEAAAVGLLVSKRKMDFTAADALYWLVAGIPLVFLFYSGVMKLPLPTAAVTGMKQSINGIVNVAAARLLFAALPHRLRRAPLSMQELIFNLLILFSLVPALLLVARASRNEMQDMESSAERALYLSGQRTGKQVNSWLKHHLDKVEHLAWMAGRAPIPMMQKGLEQSLEGEPDVLRMGLLDRDATTVAYFPLVDELGQPNIGKNFRDRPFIPILQSTLKPMLSEMVMGRIGRPKPMVTALAPVLVNGRYNGYVTGILSLDRLKEMIVSAASASVLPELAFILVDQKGSMIVSSSELQPMKPYARAEGERVKLTDHVVRWLPSAEKNMPVSRRWEKALLITEMPIGGISGWKLILEQPLAPFQKRLYERYALQFGWVFLILLAALAVAKLLSRSVVSSLHKLEAISAEIPGSLISGGEIAWPVGVITETDRLIENFRQMDNVIASQFQQILGLNENLEIKVRERTEELKESEEYLRTLVDNAADAIFIHDFDGKVLDCNRRACESLGYSRDELLRLKVQDVDPDFRPARDMTAWESLPQVGIATIQSRHRRRDGSLFPVEVRVGQIQLKTGRYAIAVVRDMSEREQADLALKTSEASLRGIIESTADGILAVDRGGRTIIANQRFADIWQIADELLQSGDDSALQQFVLSQLKDPERFLSRVKELYGSTASSLDRLEFRDGRVIERFSAPLILADAMIGRVWSFRDITERLRAEEALQAKTAQLEELTKSLEERVRLEIALRMKNEQMLIQQAKLAAMGEMIGAIAHQWRQPLNALGLNIQNIRDTYQHDELDGPFLEDAVQRAMQQIMHMSKTIDDFRTFFMADRQKQAFDVMAAVTEVIGLFSAQLAGNNIYYRISCLTHDRQSDGIAGFTPCPDKIVYGYKNEFEHVILNLISNAREAIMEQRLRDGEDLKPGLIGFEFESSPGSVVVRVTDSGSGIPDGILGRIFEPYFTTKTETKGTGMGLYMSKIIIEDHLQGRLSAGNTGRGAVVIYMRIIKET